MVVVVVVVVGGRGQSQKGLKVHVYIVFTIGTMSGPCLDHICFSFTSRPARALTFLIPSQHGLWSVYSLGPCQLGAIFELSLDNV